MTLEEKQRLALKFLSILGRPDANVVREVAVEAMIWTFPVSSIISGEANGIEAILARADHLESQSEGQNRPDRLRLQRRYGDPSQYGYGGREARGSASVA